MTVANSDLVPIVDGGPERYRTLALRLPRLLRELRSASGIQRGIGARLPASPGIYLLSEDGVPLYIGQTRNLRRRLTQHGAGYARQNQATFAFNLARLEADDSAVERSRSREQLAADPAFADRFRMSRERVARMAIRFVEVDDPELRTIFEVYASVMLGTQNSFETH